MTDDRLTRTKIADDGATLYLTFRHDGTAVYVSIPGREIPNDEACATLRELVEALIGEAIHTEQRAEVPGEWAVWVGSDLMGSGMSLREALADAIDTANIWHYEATKHLLGAGS